MRITKLAATALSATAVASGCGHHHEHRSDQPPAHGDASCPHAKEGHGNHGEGGHGHPKAHGHAPGGHAGHAGPAAAEPGRHPHKADGVHHRFDDPEKWTKVFDDPSRDAWQKPAEVIAALALPPQAVVADVGAGTGYFSVRLAKHLPQGKVYAADIEPTLIRHLADRAAKEALANVHPLLLDAKNPQLPEKVDLILIVDTYHHFPDRPGYLQRFKNSLKPGGRLVIVDFRLGEIPIGPPEEMRIAPAIAAAELQAAGFTTPRLLESLMPYQYFLEVVAP